MTFVDWINQSKERFQNKSVKDATSESAYELYLGGWRRISRILNKVNYGTPIYEKEWDLLIILDACRVDLLEEVADEFDYIEEIGTMYSVGSASYEWMENNFTSRYETEMANTVYITANPFSSELLSPADFLYLDPVWEYAWDEDIGVTRAEDITHHAVHRARKFDWDQMIVHYMQPHFPSVPIPYEKFHSVDAAHGDKLRVWNNLQKEKITQQEVWHAYRENLRYVLGEVEELLQNIDADRVAISADHGNAFGEMGIYGHPNYPLPVLREVPWVETTASDSGILDPELSTRRNDKAIEERLGDLGYLE